MSTAGAEVLVVAPEVLLVALVLLVVAPLVVLVLVDRTVADEAHAASSGTMHAAAIRTGVHRRVVLSLTLASSVCLTLNDGDTNSYCGGPAFGRSPSFVLVL